MTTVKKLWGILYIVGLIGVIIFFISQPSDDEICIQQFKKEKSISYKGKVVDKYFDKLNHNSKIIELKTREEINMDWDLSELYDFVQVNDSIVKESGSYKVKVFRDTLKYTFSIDFGCDTIINN